MLSRYRAFGWHVLASVCLATLSAGLVFGVWYPGLLARAVGVVNIFVLLLAVDLVIGPVVTLIVFDPVRKKWPELRRDMLVIAVLQMAALLYGVHSVFIARPVYVVYNVDRFDLVCANDITPEELDKAVAGEFASLPYWGPRWVAARIPSDPKQHDEVLMNALAGKGDLPQLPQYYERYEAFKLDIIKRSAPLDALVAFNQDRQDQVAQLKATYQQLGLDVGYLPLKAKAQDLTVLINRANAQVLALSDLKPWQ
jgi:hypothetical protein